MTESNIEICDLNEENESRWQSFVQDQEIASPFHTLSWRRAVTSIFDYNPTYRLVRQGEDIVGIIPGYETSGFLGTETIQPFCEYGFPILSDETDPPMVLRVITDHSSWCDTKIIKEAPHSGITGYSTAGYAAIETGLTFRLRLDGPYETIYDRRFDTEVRRNISHAKEKGVTVRTTNDVGEYYPLYLQTMKRLGSPQFPIEFFQELRRSFGDNCTILVAEIDGKLIAGVLLLSTETESIIWSNASDRAFRELTPNHLLYATAIKRAIERNQLVVDFGRTSRNSGVHRFKGQFGGRENPLVSMVTPPHRVNHASVDRYRLLEPVVRRLSPIITHELIGPRVKEWIHE